MPQKKKNTNTQSPARVPGRSNEETTAGSRHTRGLRGYHETGGGGATASSSGGRLPSSSPHIEELVQSMQEVFSHLDSEVVYIVLSECGFKVENAMDSLLELSVEAEAAALRSCPASGFELTAAVLFSSHPSDRSSDLVPPKPSESLSSPLSTSPLTAELDLLIDEELQTLAAQPKEEENQLSSEYLSSAAAPLSSFPPPPVPQQALPELLQSSLEPGTIGSGQTGAPSPIDQLSFGEGKDVKKDKDALNFSHLISPGESAIEKPNTSLDVGATGQPSVFQFYKKTDSASESSTGMPSGDMRGEVKPKIVLQSSHPVPHWNPGAPSFGPRFPGNQVPTFVLPVALSPSSSDPRVRPASHWTKQSPGISGSPKPPDTIPKLWAPPPIPQPSTSNSMLNMEGKVLVLLRGAPGSGKSTLACALLQHNPGGVVLCTDDYFGLHGDYYFDPSALRDADEWNQKRSQEAFTRGVSPIIIDKTNLQGWEMKPYVAQALRHNFKIVFREPNTWWKNKPRELARRSKHNVSVENICRILDGVQQFVTIESIMGTQPRRTSGAPSPIDQLSFDEGKDVKKDEDALNFSHPISPGESAGAKPNASLDVGATGQPSAFQIYKKTDSASESSKGMPSGDMRGEVRPKIVLQSSHPVPHWNPGAPSFGPRFPGNQVPTFVLPVALSPSSSDPRVRPASHWTKESPGIQGSPKPPDTIPKLWAPPPIPQPSTSNSMLNMEGKVLVLLRGAPGSGKSTLACALLQHNPGGVVLSTDDYFGLHGDYYFDPSTLGDAHEWNHKRSQEAFTRGVTPIIIDNTNMHGWEMKPYVAQALRHNFKIVFREPNTWWKNKPRELARRNKHRVPVEKIYRFLDSYEQFVSVQSIMGPRPFHHYDPMNKEQKPDCIVESVINEDHHADHMPVASSVSKEQRVGGEGGKRTAGLHGSQSADLVEDADQPGKVEEMAKGDVGEVTQRPELLDFVGDWPSAEPIEQRRARERDEQRRARERDEQQEREEDEQQEREEDEQQEREEEGREQHGSKIQAKMGPDVTEFQKLLDLIQTSGDVTHTSSALDGALSSSFGEVLESEWKAGGGDQGSQCSGIYGEDAEQNIIRSDCVRSELPDCVLDWKADGSMLVRESSESMLVESQGGEVQLIENSSREDPNPMVCKETVSESTDPGGCVYYPSADVLKVSDIVEANVCQDRERISYIGVEVESGTTVGDTTDGGGGSLAENSGEAVGCHIGETGQTPASEGNVETMGSGGSQERKQRRRSGKHCKLALTFTQNGPSSAPKLSTDPSPNSETQSQNSSRGSVESDVDFTSSPDCNLSQISKGTPDPGPIPDLQTKSQPLSDPVNLSVNTGCPTQTEPKDFAVLWRVNHNHSPDYPIVTMTGDPFRFVPAVCSAVSAATAVNPLGHCEVPYRMVHEKGTQVEEKEIGVTRSRLENLLILSRHFKLVNFDILEDLYDKCHQDLEWTTNLLLDSGEGLFKHDDCSKEQGNACGEDEQNIVPLCDTLERDLNIELPSSAIGECPPGDRPASGAAVGVEASHESVSAESVSAESVSAEACSESVRTTNECSDESRSNTESSGAGLKDICAAKAKSEEISGSRGGISSQETTTNGDLLGKRSNQNESLQPLLTLLRKQENMEGGCDTGQEVTSEPISEKHEKRSPDEGMSFENQGAKGGEEESSDIDEMTWLLLADLEESDKREEQQKLDEGYSRRLLEEKRSQHVDIRSLELTLPTELALQLTELFGPVGIDAGACSSDDYSVHMDLNLAKLLHQKWKDTIQERHRQAALSYHLLQESSAHWGDSQPATPGTWSADFLIGAGYESLGSQSEAQSDVRIKDHWNVSRTRVSLRDIMREEHARQQQFEQTRYADLDWPDAATLLKEKQLYDLFPGIDRQFLRDLFRDHNYRLTETEQCLRSLQGEAQVKTVVAPEVSHTESFRAASKEREKRLKLPDPAIGRYQDTEDPKYEDFREEAILQKRRQHEKFAMAAEAFKQGKKDIASFYASQGHLHGQKMREANSRAGVRIFKQVNSSLLPRNSLDLHGLHVDEALQNLAQVLQNKTAEYQQGLCPPQLSVITGRGNHSQGGVARIRPAVIDYLTNEQYRFTEPKAGLILVSLNEN